MPSFTLGQLAELLDCKHAGGARADAAITGVGTIDSAGPHDITFLANKKYAPKVKATRAAAVIASEPQSAATLASANPYYDFARALALFYQPPKPVFGIHPTAVIAATAEIGSNPSIGAYAVVAD